jgi:multisubunit Na+/H+ antiporter MnhC subunit
VAHKKPFYQLTKNNMKKFIVSLATLSMAALLFTACNSGGTTADTTTPVVTPAPVVTPVAPVAPAATTTPVVTPTTTTTTTK